MKRWLIRVRPHPGDNYGSFFRFDLTALNANDFHSCSGMIPFVE